MKQALAPGDVGLQDTVVEKEKKVVGEDET
jgi:hypothetical protein